MTTAANIHPADADLTTPYADLPADAWATVSGLGWTAYVHPCLSESAVTGFFVTFDDGSDNPTTESRWAAYVDADETNGGARKAALYAMDVLAWVEVRDYPESFESYNGTPVLGAWGAEA